MNNLISISSIQERLARSVPPGNSDEATVRRLWWAALETLQEDILLPMDFKSGLWIASPLPAMYEPRLLNRLTGWVWAPEALDNFHSKYSKLLPPSHSRSSLTNADNSDLYQRFPLLSSDGNDPLLIIITQKLQVVLSLYGDPSHRQLIIKSDSETFRDLLEMLDLRLHYENPNQVHKLRQSLAEIGNLKSNDSFEKLFWPLLSQRLAAIAPSLTLHTLPEKSRSEISDKDMNSEISLLEALSHEVRTPLATIRTLIRSLLRRNDLNELVIKRLKEIDSECTEQIDRFGLIFNAAELQRNRPNTSQFAGTDLGAMLETLQPLWSDQLARKGIKLSIEITPNLPQVLSDPQRLELMLGGLIDRNARGLKPGGILCMELRPAGQRLKLQILSRTTEVTKNNFSGKKTSSPIGTVLSWDPSTGSLQLSQAATQRLLASLGGRLAHRRDSVLTVFFPVVEANSSLSKY